MQINNFLLNKVRNTTIVMLVFLTLLVGCMTDFHEVIVDTPSDIRIVSGTVSQQTVSRVNNASQPLVVVAKCEGVKLQYVEDVHTLNLERAVCQKVTASTSFMQSLINGGASEDAQPSETGGFITSLLWSYNFPLMGSEDAQGTLEEIRTKFSGQFGNAQVNPFLYKTRCYAIPYKDEITDLLFVETYYHTERCYLDESLNYTPSRLTLFSGAGDGGYKKILDMYTNIPGLQVLQIDNSWYVKAGYASHKYYWRIVLNESEK